MPSGIADLRKVTEIVLLSLVLSGLMEHLAVADDCIQRRPKLMAHAGEEGRFVLARHLEVPVEVAELLRGAGHVGCERAELVTIADRNALSEVAGSDLVQPRVDLADRPDQRQRDRPAQDQREHNGAESETDDYRL